MAASAAVAVLPAHAADKLAADKLDAKPGFGIQLYSVAKDLQRDFAGTLSRLRAMGYTEVEFAGFGNRTAKDVRAALDAAGMTCRSAHYSVPELQDLDHTMTFAKEVGIQYMICAFPRAVQANCPTPGEWKWNADFLNTVGTQAKKAGLTVGYHNHNIEFLKTGGRTGLEDLMQRTDPAAVTFELDCGWAAAAGVDPVGLLAAYPGRFRLLHVKDIRRGMKLNTTLQMDPAEVGKGTLDWMKVLSAAAAAGVQQYYVELEPALTPAVFDAVRDTRDYLVKL